MCKQVVQANIGCGLPIFEQFDAATEREERKEAERAKECKSVWKFLAFKYLLQTNKHKRSYNAFFASFKRTPAMRLPKLMLDFEFFAECWRSMRNMPLPLLYTNEFRLPLIIVYSLIFLPSHSTATLSCVHPTAHLSMYMCMFIVLLCV